MRAVPVPAAPTPGATDPDRPRIALALSGGGFRASLFHLGVLRRLAEGGLLASVDVLSTVSGGSIIGAYAALRWQKVLAAGGDWPALERHIVTPFTDLITTKNFLLSWVGTLPRSFVKHTGRAAFSRTAVAADLYDQWFFHGATLDELPASPRLVINATSLPSIRAWRFTHDGMGDSRYGYAQWERQTRRPPPVSLAVGASAAFPPVFTPVRIRLDEYAFSPPPYGPRPDVTSEMPLSDGGVYDNLGLEVLTRKEPLPAGTTLSPPQILVVSDAGHPATYKFTASRLPIIGALRLMGRVRDISREQVAALRRRGLVHDFERHVDGTTGILVTMKSDIENLHLADRTAYAAAVGTASLIPPVLLPMIQTIRTSLDRFSKTEVEALLYHAYTMTDAFWWAYLAPTPRPAPNPSWKLTFDEERIRAWARALAHSSKRFRLRREPRSV